MTIVLNGTSGITNVDGTAAAPALTGTDTDTGIFFPAANTLAFSTNGTEDARFDSSGNLGLGVTPSAWDSSWKAFQIGTRAGFVSAGDNSSIISQNARFESGWKYISTAAAGLYVAAFNGQHQWYNAPAGTAGNAITFTQAMTLDASGRLLVGTTTASGSNRLLVDAANSGSEVIRAQNTGGTGARIASWADGSATLGSGPNFYMQNVTGPNTWAASMQMGASAEIIFFQYPNSSWSERARIDSSGNLLVGTTSAYGAGVTIVPSGVVFASRSGDVSGVFDRTSSDGQVVNFRRQGNTVGSISVTTTSTSYNTSSDYRLKENIQPMTGALAFVRKQRPVTYNWKADGSEGAGYIAHWMQEDGAGNCVTGEKDAVDAEGNPQYQGIDTSFMVAPLNAAINELADIVDAQAAIIEQLKADVAALKGNA